LSVRTKGTLILVACAALVAGGSLGEQRSAPRGADPGVSVFVVPDPPPGTEDGPPTQWGREPGRRLSAAALTDPAGLKKYEFFPQAGRPGRDLFINNFTDLDGSAGIKDWDCTGYTYDGHRGHDIGIRSFREQEIGVPVFAVLDGTVVTAADGNPDTNTSCAGSGNGVVLDHGNSHRTIYWHLRRGSVKVRAGQRVMAGQELGLTASSGCSTWPHLHFESWLAGAWYEPSAGSCRAGTSQWSAQPPVHRGLLVSGFYLTDQMIPCCDGYSLALDLPPEQRRAAMVIGSSGLQSRVDLHNVPGGSNWRYRVLRPNGALANDRSGLFGNASLARHAFLIFRPETGWNEVGTWRFQLLINNALVVDAPFAVVATLNEAPNRPPKAIGLSLSPPTPKAGKAVTCQIDAPLVAGDPDYDLVRYRYAWRADGKLLRSVTSAAMSDTLRRDLVRRGELLSCMVTPNDGRVDGPMAMVRRKVAS
jgi:hypothetical protein